jgi:hypothetical protein
VHHNKSNLSGGIIPDRTAASRGPQKEHPFPKITSVCVCGAREAAPCQNLVVGFAGGQTTKPRFPAGALLSNPTKDKSNHRDYRTNPMKLNSLINKWIHRKWISGSMDCWGSSHTLASFNSPFIQSSRRPPLATRERLR